MHSTAHRPACRCAALAAGGACGMHLRSGGQRFMAGPSAKGNRCTTPPAAPPCSTWDAALVPLQRSTGEFGSSQPPLQPAAWLHQCCDARPSQRPVGDEVEEAGSHAVIAQLSAFRVAPTDAQLAHSNVMLTGGEVEEEGALIVLRHIQEIQRLGGQHICSKIVR